MYIESEFALLEAQNEQLTRENRKLAEALAAVFMVLDEDYGHGISNGYWPTVAPIHKQAKQALLPYQEECSCLPDLPDGRVNGGRGGCCPVCEADSIPSSIDITTWE